VQGDSPGCLLHRNLPELGAKDQLEGRPKLAAWWRRVQERPSTKKARGEQQAALAAVMKK